MRQRGVLPILTMLLAVAYLEFGGGVHSGVIIMVIMVNLVIMVIIMVIMVNLVIMVMAVAYLEFGGGVHSGIGGRDPLKSLNFKP